MVWLARGAFFLSGVAGLCFEIVWLRHLGLALGATTLAVATTTAAYMGGLALGSHLGGRVADRLRRPLLAYGLVEIGVGLLGGLVPLACAVIPAVDERLFASLESAAGRGLVRFFVAVAVLGVPTTAMGMTLPVLARAVVAKLGAVGREVGTLYAANLAGAVAGAALTGFVLVPSLGLRATNLVAVSLDVGLGLVACVVGARLAALPAASPRAPNDEPVLRPGTSSVIAVLVLTGAAAMSLQVLWTRALGTALGPSTYAFSAIVCAYLVGLAVGGAVASRIADRMAGSHVALVLALLFTAAAALFGINVVDELPLLLRPVVVDKSLTMAGLVRSQLALAGLSLVPATIGMGTLFPLTLAAVAGSEKHIGAAVGRSYALNTVGNIAGSFAAVFVLLPALGVEWGLRASALAYVAAAAVLLTRAEPSGRRRHVLALLTVVTAGVLFVWPGWNVGQWTLGMFRASMARSYFSDGDVQPSRVVFHGDGLSSTVTVEEDLGIRWVKVNGKIDGSSEGDMPTQILSGLVPMLVHPRPREVAVIGCGTCVTAGAALRGNPEHLTLIELEKEVVRAARLFADVNHEPWNDSRFTLAVDDGRNFMMRRGPPFDVIVSEPSNPWMTGAASLFTLEFFRIAAARLAPGGMFLQWLQAYELAPERIASVVRTFNTVFPYVVVFSAHADSNDLLLLGSRDPITMPRERLARRFVELASELARAEVHTLDELLALVVLTSDELRELPADIPLNTDDNALIEFGAPKDLVVFAEDDPELPLLERYAGHRAEMVARLGGLEQGDAALLGLARGYLDSGMLQDAQTSAEQVIARSRARPELFAEASLVRDLAELLADDEDREPVIDDTQASPSREYLEAARLVHDGKLDEALSALEGPGTRPPYLAVERLLYAYLLIKHDRFAAARRQLLAAEPDLARSILRPAVLYYLARGSFGDGAFSRAAAEIRRYHDLRRHPLSLSGKAD